MRGRTKKVKDNKKEIWYKAELTYKIDNQEETKKGWLAQKDIKLFSAYDWHKFGFQKLNAGSEFVYSLKDIKEEHVNATVPKDQIAPFIKKVWDIIDTDGDKKLTPIELELAFEDPEKVETLSKLVCTHKSEWSYETEKIKTEAEEIYNLAMGTNPSEKLKKQKESRILALENRMKELMFWQEAKNLAYTGKVDTKLPARVFPSDDNVHYFHPLSWVRQMKLLEDNNTIYVTRKWEHDTGVNKTSTTISSFSLNDGKIKGYIAEPHGEATADRGKDKCIPVGEYKLVWHTSKKFSKDKYVKKKYPELKNGFPKLYNKNVPKSRGILIHVGNKGKDTEGCLLPGSNKQLKNKDVIGVNGSFKMFYELIDFIEKKGIENIRVVIKEEF